ncbi:MAG TPA: histidine kinase [Thermoleophilaceae bacterium]|nr:histidine kinase [Thermoleophilaceae bacterium]
MTNRIARGDAWTIAAFGCLFTAGAVLISLTGGMPDSAGLAERYALIVGVPIAVGLYAWRDGRHARFGRLLVLTGFGWFLPSLSASSNDVLYSVGRIAGWTVEVALIYLVLAFPSGRLQNRIDRGLLLAIVAIVGLLYMPTVLIDQAFPQPSPWASCVPPDCPGNAFMVASSEPGILEDAIVPLRELLVILLMAAVAVRLGQRVARATPLMRRTLSPVLAMAMVRVGTFGAAIAARRADADETVTDVLIWVILLGLPAMSIAFLIGLVRWRLFTADALLRLAVGIRHDPHPAELRELIAKALGDPSVELAYRDPGVPTGWVDGDGEPIPAPRDAPGRCCTAIVADGRPVAAILHDDVLADQRSFVQTVGAYALTWEDNHRLAARVDESLRELRESRARILAAADDERRRIERDLHDGGQQRLVALRIRLELADETMRESPARARRMLQQLGTEVDAALDELRSLAAGVYPSLLADRGLTDALRSAALRSPVPVSVAVNGDDRYGQDVEAAVYFCCLEALQNVAKHAPEARAVAISLERNGDLRFSVSDDGPGFDAEIAGNGLVNMRDRVAAVGGTLEIRTAPGDGTEIVGHVPVPE